MQQPGSVDLSCAFPNINPCQNFKKSKILLRKNIKYFKNHPLFLPICLSSWCSIFVNFHLFSSNRKEDDTDSSNFHPPKSIPYLQPHSCVRMLRKSEERRKMVWRSAIERDYFRRPLLARCQEISDR